MGLGGVGRDWKGLEGTGRDRKGLGGGVQEARSKGNGTGSMRAWTTSYRRIVGHAQKKMHNLHGLGGALS
eukprot:203014-Prorocentrum_minimum.AAC.4